MSEELVQIVQYHDGRAYLSFGVAGLAQKPFQGCSSELLVRRHHPDQHADVSIAAAFADLWCHIAGSPMGLELPVDEEVDVHCEGRSAADDAG